MTGERRIMSKKNKWILHLSTKTPIQNQLNTDIQVMSSQFIDQNSWQKLIPSKWYIEITFSKRNTERGISHW